MPHTGPSCQRPGQHDQPGAYSASGTPMPTGPTWPFAVEVRLLRGTAVVVLSGEADITVAPTLAEHLMRILASRPRRIVFDMARVTFLDCATARLITRTGQSLRPGNRVLILQPNAIVRRVLDLTGLASCCDVKEQFPEAL